MKPRLLIISDCAHGGTFHVATLLAEGLRDDFAISFVAPLGGEGAQATAALRGLDIEISPSEFSYENLYHMSYARDEAAEVLDATRPDLILCVDGAELCSLLAIKTVARCRDIPYVTIINLLSEDVRERFAPFLAESAAALREAEAVVFVSEASRRRCERLLPDVRMSAHVIPNSVAETFFAPADPAARAHLRHSLGIPEETLLCLTAARIEQRKGQTIGVAALGRLKSEGRLGTLHWLLAGRAQDWDRRRFEEAVAAAGVSHHVSLLGERDDVHGLLDASDLFILTSYAEGMPLSIIEALARGVPVIATAIDGIIEQVDESCGILLPSPAEDEDACLEGLTRALEQLQHDRDLLRRMSEAARERARSLFHPDIGVARYRALMAEIAQNLPTRVVEESGLDRPSLDTSLDFSDPSLIWNHLKSGWSVCEKDGVWTDGLVSTMRVRLEGDMTFAKLRFALTPFKRLSKRSTRIYVNDRLVTTWQLRNGRQQHIITIDVRETGHALRLKFENPGATRPCDIGMGGDYRQLGLFFHRLDISSASRASNRWSLNDRLRGWLGISP